MSGAADTQAMRRPLSVPAQASALLLIDLQEEHRHDARYLVEGYDRVIANAARLLDTARKAGIPACHFGYAVDTAEMRPFHPVTSDGRSAFSDKDDPLTAICAEVAPAGEERLVVKSEASAFGTGLGDDLKARGISWLFVAGVWTEACVDATVKDAIRLGFHVVLVKDACGSATPDMHVTGILNLANRLYGGAVVDTARARALMEGETVEAWMVEGAVPLRITFANAEALFDGM